MNLPSKMSRYVQFINSMLAGSDCAISPVHSCVNATCIKQQQKSRLDNSWPSYALGTKLGGCVNDADDRYYRERCAWPTYGLFTSKYGCYENCNAFIHICINSLRQFYTKTGLTRCACSMG